MTNSRWRYRIRKARRRLQQEPELSNHEKLQIIKVTYLAENRGRLGDAKLYRQLCDVAQARTGGIHD